MTSPQNYDADSMLLATGGNPGWKFKNIGETHTGVISGKGTAQQKVFGTGEPKTYKNGKPAMQIVVTLETDERDPSIEGDDGRRTWYIKEYGPDKDALAKAVQESGAAMIEIGARVTVTYVKDGVPASPGLNGEKLKTVKYVRPADVALAAPAQGTVWDKLPAPAAPQAAAKLDVTGLSPEMVAVLKAQGLM